MEYLEVMNAKIYIHDSVKDVFYELEDLRYILLLFLNPSISLIIDHNRDIRDRSVLRLFEPNINGNGAVPAWDQDQSYFSEPEFDSDFQQHIHKTKGNKTPPYVNYSYATIGATATLPRNARPFSPAPGAIKALGSGKECWSASSRNRWQHIRTFH